MFVLPTIANMIFLSVYGIVDGLFISNFAGKVAFASVNVTFPIFSVLGVFGLMIGTGGSAIIGKTLGEQNPEKANGYFSFFVFPFHFLSQAVPLKKPTGAISNTTILQPTTTFGGTVTKASRRDLCNSIPSARTTIHACCLSTKWAQRRRACRSIPSSTAPSKRVSKA